MSDALELKRARAQVRVLRQLSSEVNATLEPERIYEILLRTMDEVFAFQHSMILLLHSPEVLSVVASRGYDPPGLGAEAKVGVGVIGVVAQKKKMMRMNNLGQQRAYMMMVKQSMGRTDDVVALPGLAEADAQIAVPMMIEDRLIGVFMVESNTGSVFEEADETLVSLVANQAASAIENARSYRMLEERVQERTRELREAQAKLVQSSKMASLGELVAGVAHEINTPMGAVSSSHQTILRAVERLDGLVAEDDAKVRRVLRALGDAARAVGDGASRVESIVTRLRSFARLDQAEVQRIDINDCVRDAISLFESDLDERISVAKELHEAPPIECYPGKLNQLILNLLTNARDAIEGEGTVSITTRLDGPQVHVCVSDDGSGIPTGDLSKIFDPGFTTKGVGVGTGLGLSICYQIAEEHGGSIRVDSVEGVGSTFTLSLPA